MANENPFSIPALVSALKEAGFATKDDVFEQLTEFYAEKIKPDMDEFRSEMRDSQGEFRSEIHKGLIQMNEKVDQISVDLSHNRDEIRDLKVELSDHPSNHQFNELKTRVATLEATS